MACPKGFRLHEQRKKVIIAIILIITKWYNV